MMPVICVLYNLVLRKTNLHRFGICWFSWCKIRKCHSSWNICTVLIIHMWQIYHLCRNVKLIKRQTIGNQKWCWDNSKYINKSVQPICPKNLSKQYFKKSVKKLPKNLSKKSVKKLPKIFPKKSVKKFLKKFVEICQKNFQQMCQKIYLKIGPKNLSKIFAKNLFKNLSKNLTKNPLKNRNASKSKL